MTARTSRSEPQCMGNRHEPVVFDPFLRFERPASIPCACQANTDRVDAVNEPVSGSDAEGSRIDMPDKNAETSDVGRSHQIRLDDHRVRGTGI